MKLNDIKNSATCFLLAGLSGKADRDNNGIITFTEVALYVETEVLLYTSKNFSRTQRPERRYEFGAVRHEIPMAINRRKVNIQIQSLEYVYWKVR